MQYIKTSALYFSSLPSTLWHSSRQKSYQLQRPAKSVCLKYHQTLPHRVQSCLYKSKLIHQFTSFPQFTLTPALTQKKNANKQTKHSRLWEKQARQLPPPETRAIATAKTDNGMHFLHMQNVHAKRGHHHHHHPGPSIREKLTHKHCS